MLPRAKATGGGAVKAGRVESRHHHRLRNRTGRSRNPSVQSFHFLNGRSPFRSGERRRPADYYESAASLFCRRGGLDWRQAGDKCESGRWLRSRRLRVPRRSPGNKSSRQATSQRRPSARPATAKLPRIAQLRYLPRARRPGLRPTPLWSSVPSGKSTASHLRPALGCCSEAGDGYRSSGEPPEVRL